MGRLLLSSLLVVVLLALISQVYGDYGKVTCSGKDKVGSVKLMGLLVTAKCTLPKDMSDEAAAGSITRCVYTYMKVFTPPSTFSKAKAETEMVPIFPKKYQASFKTKIAACLKAHSKDCKSEKDDQSGKTWAPLFNCFNNWYNTELCA